MAATLEASRLTAIFSEVRQSTAVITKNQAFRSFSDNECNHDITPSRLWYVILRMLRQWVAGECCEKSDPAGRKGHGNAFSDLERPSVALDRCCSAAGHDVRCPADLFHLPRCLVRLVLSTVRRCCLDFQEKVPTDYGFSVREPFGICHCVLRSLKRLACKLSSLPFWV